MGLRQREWAARTTETLRAMLGACCSQCGCREDLEFDCIKPQGPKHHKMEWSWRLSFYRSQHQAGNLQLLCGTCNARKGDYQCGYCRDSGVRLGLVRHLDLPCPYCQPKKHTK